jgi:microcystin-dependent protein
MDEYLGIVKLFAGTFVPKGWALCDGQLLNINQNTALFSLLGTYFGGDGRTTFGLPDLRKAVPAPNLTYIICVQGSYPERY